MEKAPFLPSFVKVIKAVVLVTLVFQSINSAPVFAQSQGTQNPSNNSTSQTTNSSNSGSGQSRFLNDSNNGVAGFSSCQLGSGEGGADQIGECIRQVLTFVLVVGVFIALFRIAFVAFKSSNPVTGGGGTTAEMVKALQQFAIGIFILGTPVLVINLVNPALLNLDFLQGIANLDTQNPGNGSSNSNSNSGSNTSSTISGSNANIGGTKPSDLQSAVDTYNSNPGDAQAQATIKKVLEAKRRCEAALVSNFDECKAIEDPGFQEAINNVPQDAQQTLGGGATPETIFNNGFTPTQDLIIGGGLGTDFRKIPAPGGCDKYIIKIGAGNGVGQLNLEKCNQVDSSDLFTIDTNGQLTVNGGFVLEKGKKINEQVTFQPI